MARKRRYKRFYQNKGSPGRVIIKKTPTPPPGQIRQVGVRAPTNPVPVLHTRFVFRGGRRHNSRAFFASAQLARTAVAAGYGKSL